jgi:outer membrane lipopolysaccharide assembly protein LptE/RlpB
MQRRNFPKYRFISVLCAVILVSLLSGCGYRLTGSAGERLTPGQTLWVAFIGNETDSSSAQTVIRRALLDEGHAMRGLIPAGSESDSDLRVNGSLRSYYIKAISYNAIDQVREYRLIIDVELELHRKGVTAPLWKGTLRASKDYPANINNAFQHSAEEEALVAASHILAQKLLTLTEQSY